MKSLQEFVESTAINEVGFNDGKYTKFNPHGNPKHKEAYNDLLKWVDEQDEKGNLHGENYYEILEYALKRWKDNNFNDL